MAKQVSTEIMGTANIPKMKCGRRPGINIEVMEKALELDEGKCVKLSFNSQSEAKSKANNLRVLQRYRGERYGSIVIMKRGSDVYLFRDGAKVVE